MLFLVLSVLCSTLVIHTFRFAQNRGYAVDRLLLVNYLLAAGIGWATAAPALAAGVGLSWALAALGGVTGLLFIGNFYLLDRAVAALGPTLAGAASRLSAVVPVVLSIVVFAEVPGPLRWAGIALAVAALPFSLPGGPAKARVRSWLPAVLVFVGFGINDFSLKLHNEWFAADTKPLFLAVVYSVALTVAAVRVLTRRRALQGPGWLAGGVLGVANFLSTLFLALALGSLPGSLAYALASLGVVLTVTVTSALVWKERPTARTWLFLVLAVAAIGLIQVG